MKNQIKYIVYLDSNIILCKFLFFNITIPSKDSSLELTLINLNILYDKIKLKENTGQRGISLAEGNHGMFDAQ